MKKKKPYDTDYSNLLSFFASCNRFFNFFFNIKSTCGKNFCLVYFLKS